MPIALYDVPRVATLVLPETTGAGAVRMNYPVAKTDFAILKGLPQTLQFFVRDIDRQVVDGTGLTLTALISNPDNGGALLLQKDLVLQDPAQGLYALTLLPLETIGWPLAPLNYAVLATRAGVQTLLWTDRDYTPYGVLTVRETPFPGPVAPVALDPSTFVINQQWAQSSALAVTPYANAVQTFAISSTGFTGTVRIQGTLLAQPTSDNSTWFDVASHDFAAVTATTAITTTGHFTFMRVLVSVAENPLAFLGTFPDPIVVVGTVDSILAKV